MDDNQNPSDKLNTPATENDVPKRRWFGWLWRLKPPDTSPPPDTPSEPSHTAATSSPASTPTAKRLPRLSPPILALDSFAPLDTVGTENYIRYGVQGPKRYLSGMVERIPTPEQITIQVAITKGDDTALLTLAELSLQRIEHQPHKRTIWALHDAQRHAQLKWVWDFYRILSYVQIQIEAPDEAPTTGPWFELLQACQQLVVGDELVIHVSSKSGEIHQTHKIEHAPSYHQ